MRRTILNDILAKNQALRNQIDDIRREKNMYYQIHTDLKQELSQKKEELVILID